MTGWQTLVDARALAAALGREDVVVVDCRHALADPGAGRAAWQAGHVPGARHAHLDEDLSGDGAATDGRHPWPRAEAFTARLGSWGISPSTQVVAYDAADGAMAARLWCLLKALGHDDVAVLDGGWAAWCEAGLPVETAQPVVRPARYEARFGGLRLFDADAVQRHLAAGGLLIDARAPERFRGEVEPIDRVAGHVPGAINRPYAANLEGGRMKAPAVLRQEFSELLGTRDAEDVVVMCGSGVTACQHLLAMAHAGLSNGHRPAAGLFTASWSGWSSDPSRPVATGPGASESGVG